VRAPKEVLHKLQFFVELLHGGAEFVEQSQTPPKFVTGNYVGQKLEFFLLLSHMK